MRMIRVLAGSGDSYLFNALHAFFRPTLNRVEFSEDYTISDEKKCYTKIIYVKRTVILRKN